MKSNLVLLAVGVAAVVAIPFSIPLSMAILAVFLGVAAKAVYEDRKEVRNK